ncbi:TIR domain-containing protein [Saccharopolyspora antimicrobica]|uniref:TIR domain-containing protein n=1 Tax=Saccharopolyspora antimicrobica TaxID=455193 RepID=A0A1I4WWT2_9PSEU|nr:toll/interleukin-1 receptor domain-containing protein [Saccharopolyspora antimicrobica]RKT84183.1 TIR domain-containing protein [Saccharopolyspora antimicrobica]SFN17935.1 TIR domain-containing protein [Saccharopolyspora antimicrobica]
MVKRVFVSYSRRDFHFAEAAVAVLRTDGLDPWLDVQRLVPGEDWATALDDALADADALLLLASPAALASEHVRREWTSAVERGIPVHIGAVAAVELPGELADRPVHDLRTRFRARATVLAEVISGNREAPARRARGLPVPAPVAAVVALAAATAIATGWATAILVGLDVAAIRLSRGLFNTSWVWEASAWDALLGQRWRATAYYLLGLTVFAAPLVPTLLTSAVGLLRRRAGPLVLLTGPAATAAVGTLLFVAVGLSVGGRGRLDEAAFITRIFPPTPEMVADVAAMRVLLVVAVGCALAQALIVLLSRTVHLWTPTGSGLDIHRRAIAGVRPLLVLASPATRYRRSGYYDGDFPALWAKYTARLAELPDRGAAPVVEVECLAPQDEPVAELLRAACRDAGMAGGPGPRWTFVLISSHASWPAVVRAVGASGPPAICVLVDSIRLPPDAEALRRHQWVDFRDRRPDHLFHLLAALLGRSPTEQAPAPPPVVTTRFLAPCEVRFAVESCRHLAAAFPGFALVTLLFQPLDPRSAALAVVTAPLVAGLVVLSRRMATRRIALTRFRWSLAALCAGTVLWCAVAVTTLREHWERQAAWGPPSAEPEGLEALSDMVPLEIVLSFPAGAVALCALLWTYLLRGWLPRAVTGAGLRAVGPEIRAGFIPWMATPGIILALAVQYLATYP